jgi:AcrR family transcriptional regulator
MRRLARELGVEAMSLYHHFPNKEAIMAGVIDLALMAEAPTPGATPPASWREPVAAAVLGFRRVLVKHPNVLPQMAAHPPVSGSSRAYIEGPLQYLAAQGFSDSDATDLFQALFAYAFGHAMLSTSYGTIEVPGTPSFSFTEEAFSRTLAVLLRGYEPVARTPAEA